MNPVNKEHFQFTLDFQVRDYECDFQGIVNHAVYLHYLEHARHEFAKQLGLNIVEFAQKGINLVIIRAELDYKHPLRHGDRFVVGINRESVSRLRLAFHQTIFIPETGMVMLQARLILAPMNDRGKPFLPDELKAFFHLEFPL